MNEVSLDEAKEILRKFNLTSTARSGDGEYHYFSDAFETEYSTVIHAEIQLNSNKMVEHVQFSSIIGLMTLSTGQFSITHSRLGWFIEQLRECAYSAERKRKCFLGH